MSPRTPFSAVRRLLVVSLVVVVSTATLTACGGGDDDSDATGTPGATSSTTESPTTAESPQTSGPETPEGTEGTGKPPKSPRSTDEPSSNSSPGSTASTGKPPKGDQVSVLDTLPGSAKNSCLNVKDDMTVRSGDLAMGNFQQARQQFSQDQSQTNALYFFVVPQHAGSMPGATVKASKPGSGTKTFRSDGASSADQWKYYPVNVSLTGPGSWTFQVAAGQDRGCFVADF
jgi:hypothetical protein